LVRFFDAYQRNELGRAAGETLLVLAFFAIPAKEISAKINGQSQKLSPSATSFLLISVTARAGARANSEAGPEGASAMDGASQRNGSKEKRFPVQS
jgi:hypothetical protein